MQPPQTRGSKPRGDMQPSLLSPSFSRKPFQATAAAAPSTGGDQDADASSEHPCVTLFEWWLERVEGDDQKVAVAGTFERNQTVLEFAPATIAKRHEACILETEDRIILFIYGSLSLSRMRANGYSSEVCEKFMIGFPYWWKNCNQLYPKAAQTGSDAKQFYLEKFQLGQQFHSYGSSLLSELRNSVKKFSHNDAAFQKSSHLPNGASRFEENNSDGDIAINENVAASNDNGERHEAARNEAYNVEMETDLIACRTLRERDDGDIDTNASLVLIVECVNDASNEEADNPPSTIMCKKRDPVVPTNEDAAASNGNSERCTAVSEEVNSVETGLTVGSTIRERGHDDIATNVSSAPTVECTNDAVNEGVDNTSLLGCRKTPVASLKTQGCQEKHQYILSNDKVVLVDWWLEREEGEVRVAGIPQAPQMRKGASSSKVAGRVFRSAAIARRHDDTAIESVDGCKIRIGRVLNKPRTQGNGFSEEVCECFEFGFPIRWLKYVNPNMEQQNEQSQSESTANAPRHSVDYYMEMLLRDTSTNPMRYAFTENDFYSSIGYTSNTDGPAIQSLSNLTDDNAGNMAASWGLYGGTRNMPEKPLTPPGETCSGQESDRHERTQISASEQGIVNRSVSSVSVNLSTGSICPNSKVDESILVPSKIVPVDKEGYRSRVDNSTSSDLGEPGTPKCGKAAVNLGATDALELTTEGMTPQFGAVRGSEDSTVRRLRSGKVFGTPSGGPVKRRYKKKNIQHEASSKMMAPNEGGTSTTDLTSHENDSSAAGIVAEDEESHASHRKRQGRHVKNTKRKREFRRMFSSFL